MERKHALSQRPLEEGINEVSQLLGERVETVLATDRTITRVVREDYQSPTFQAARFNYVSEQFGTADRSLHLVTFNDGVQAYIISGKVSSGSPYEVGHAVDGGIDMRSQIRTVYIYDGHETITEIGPAGETDQYTGEYGNPEILLMHARRALGTHVGTESFIPTTNQS